MAESDFQPDILQQHLKDLELENQSLASEEAQLELRLGTLRKKLSSNQKAIQHKMVELNKQQFEVKRASHQALFRETISQSEDVVKGLWVRMTENPGLKRALEVLSKAENNDDHVKAVSLALMMELSGKPVEFLRNLATRILEYEPEDDRLQYNLGNNDGVNPILLEDGNSSSGRPASIRSVMSSEVKSEHNSPLLSALKATIPTREESTIELYSNLGSSRQTPESMGTAPLERNYPELLAYLVETKRAGKKTPRNNIEPPPTPKRAASVMSDNSLFGSPAPPAPKRAKSEAHPAAYNNFLKLMEDKHKQGQRITDDITCANCKIVRRDARVLNCLHLYCHRCTQKLRNEALKGDAVRGFQAYCVKPNCRAIIMGKTAIIDPEVIEFLIWYDGQVPAIGHAMAHIQALQMALDKKPGDAKLKEEVKKLRKASLGSAGGQLDKWCDVLEIAKVIVKL